MTPPNRVEAHAHTDSAPIDYGVSHALVWLAGVVFLSSLVGVVILEALERPTGTLVTLVTPVVAALLVSGHVSNVTRQQNVAINKIERQTNGVLDERIRTQVLSALEEAAPLPVVPAVEVAPAGDVDAAGPSTSTLPAGFVNLAGDNR